MANGDPIAAPNKLTDAANTQADCKTACLANNLCKAYEFDAVP